MIFSLTSKPTQENNSIIRFQDLTVTIKGLETFDQKQLDKVFASQAMFSADLGETLESAIVIVETDRYKNIEIYQAFETSMTIMNEGPHCDLLNWKHHTSDWRKLKEAKLNVFETIIYPANESKKFPAVTIKEVQEATRKQCGDDWAELIKDTKSVHEYPFDVGINKYFLNVNATDKATGAKIEKEIVILIPMGC